MILALLLACAPESMDPESIMQSGVYCLDDQPHVRWETEEPGLAMVTFLSAEDRDSEVTDVDYTCVQIYFSNLTCDEAQGGMFFINAAPVTGEVPDCKPGWTDQPFDPDAIPIY